VINLIANTTTQSGLKIQAALDQGIYPRGIMVSDRELDAVNLKRAQFHSQWNYILCHRAKENSQLILTRCLSPGLRFASASSEGDRDESFDCNNDRGCRGSSGSWRRCHDGPNLVVGGFLEK
jgi:hypothetical protein